MQKIRIGIVEDEVIIADNIANLLQELDYDVCEPCSNYTEALSMLETEQPDLILLDINLARSKDGIEIAKYIKSNYNIPFIFLTANSDKATFDKAKEVNPGAYLVKPFQKADLYTSIELAFYNYYQQKANPNQPVSLQADIQIAKNSLFIKEGNYFYKVNFAEIRYLSSDHVYVTVHTAKKNFLVRSSMQEYIVKFDPRKFIRVHRSYVVNMDMVEKINSAYLIVDGEQVPISKNHRENLMELLQIG